ncbi:MAG: TonB-dependent receptor [Saprospiraceae bacterium]|nr:TonB-dependent receptor [Saprospiraceae bacterium]
MLRFFTALVTLVAFSGLSASAQTLRGIVLDADLGSPITGAAVTIQQLQSPENTLTVATDADGRFQFDTLRPGLYQLELKKNDFEQLILTQVDVTSGKERVLELTLRKAATTLPDVVITAPTWGRRSMRPLSEIPLTREQTLRYPAVFFDPARVAMMHAGVVNNDDQANGLSIRGNSPGSLRWRIDGVEVTNPNHLPNAGTFSDLPVSASGGVLMFSAQMLDNTALLTGNYPAGMGDAQGGVMDLSLRSGNNHRHEFTLQAGLLGLDVAAEGPLGKGANAPSYLVNYRYSTVGLLSEMGISFGDEDITFQDLSLNLSFPGKRGGGVTVFGLAGKNANYFEHKDSADIELYKDYFDIDFASRTGIGGVSGLVRLGSKTWLKTSAIVSGQSSERDQTLQVENPGGIVDEFQQEETRIGGTISVKHSIHPRLRFEGGINAQDIRFEQNTAFQFGGFSFPDSSGALHAQLGWAWLNADWRCPSENTAVQFGLQYTTFSQGNASALEPRLTVTQRLNDKHQLSFSYGLNSQVQPLWVYTQQPNFPIETGNPNRELGFTRAHHAGLRHTLTGENAWSIRTELFYQRLFDVPVSASGLPAFSMVNALETQAAPNPNAYPVMVQDGIAENKGFEITAERYLSLGWFMMANVTLYDARYQGNDGVWRNTRWNTTHMMNVLAGKEWIREVEGDKSRTFGLNARFGWSGGMRAMPIDTLASQFNILQKTVYDQSEGFTERLPDYLRLDLRVYWKWNLGNRRNSTFGMDLQNVTLRQNVAYYYWDPHTQAVETKYQLGLIPNISWRLEF